MHAWAWLKSDMFCMLDSVPEDTGLPNDEHVNTRWTVGKPGTLQSNT